MTTMTPLDRVRKVHVDIMRHPKWCAFSGIIAMGDTSISDTCPTAYTDGRNKVYGKAFVESLNDKQLRLLVLHENAGHVAYQHLRTWRHLYEKNPRAANAAADHFVNLSLMDSDAGEGWLEMPPVGVMPEPRYRGWSVQMIFDDLVQGGSGSGFDEHDWEAAKSLTPEEADNLVEEVSRALRQGEMVARARGQGKGGGSLMVGDLLASKKDWRAILADFVQDTCNGGDESTWRRPSRRYLAEGVYMPSTESTQMGELIVGIDTSGSCFSGTYITRFVSEMAAIIDRVRPSKVRLLFVDDGVQGEQVFEDGQFAVAAVKPTGGGGTDLTTAFTYVKEKGYEPAAMVIFTDGDTPFGVPPGYPVLWAITNPNKRAPWGTTIHIDV